MIRLPRITIAIFRLRTKTGQQHSPCGLMKEHKLERYAFDDHIVEMLPGESKLKVRTAKDEDSDDDE